jgi:alkylation response protein AidB-like acyl-CoA dehydrogenase
MNFDLNADQEMLSETVDRLLADRFPLSFVRTVFDGPDGYTDDLWYAMGELGLFAILLPTEYGGLGGELLDLAVAAERLGYGAAPGPFIEHVLATLAILLAGSDDQKREWLPRLAGGACRASLAIAERDAIWTISESRAEANRRLRGTKQWVPYPDTADVLVVGTAGGFTLVRKDAPGMSIEPLQTIDRSRRLAIVDFDDVEHEPLPGEGTTFERVRDAGLILLAADAYGSAARCVDLAVDHAKTREQFGVTIGHFQALKHQLADLVLDVDSARFLYWYAAHTFDHAPDELARFAALAKAHVTDMAVRAGRLCVEYHGGIGFTWAHDVHFFLKRAIFDRAYFGTPDEHRGRVAALNHW